LLTISSSFVKNTKKSKSKRAPASAKLSPWFVYILECKDKSFYTGITSDLARRFKQHKSGNGGRYTRMCGVKRLVYHEPAGSRSDALKREAQIKTWPRLKKMALVSGQKAVLKKITRKKKIRLVAKQLRGDGVRRNRPKG
jgi:putative endonuclease